MKDQKGLVYTQRLENVLRYIETHLDERLNLNELSKRAFYSPYHFHRIFRQVVGETLNDYIVRRRIEKAASMLLHSSTSISEIARNYGFSSLASFSKSFKKFYGYSPKEFRLSNDKRYSKIGQFEQSLDDYLRVINTVKNWIKMSGIIELKNLQEMHLGYLSCKGLNKIPETYNQLMKWAKKKDLMSNDEKMISIFHDSLKITSPEMVRVNACILLDKNYTLEDDLVSKQILNPGTCLVGRFEIRMEEFEKSWIGMFIEMNDRGLERNEVPPFEIYHNDFRLHPENKCIVELCIPVLEK